MLIQNMYDDVTIDRKSTTYTGDYDLLVGFYGHISVSDFYKEYATQILESFGWATPTERDIQLVYDRIFNFFDFPIEKGLNVCQVLENMNANDVSSEHQNECFRSAIMYADDTVGCLINELQRVTKFQDHVLSRNENGVVLLHEYITEWEWKALETPLYTPLLDLRLRYIVSKYDETLYKVDSIGHNRHINKLDSFENLVALCYETIQEYENRKSRNRKIGLGALALFGGLYIWKKYKE
jgi:hypothetical protein